MSETENNRPATGATPAAPQHGGNTRFFDKWASIIIGGFAVLALLVVYVMGSGYRHSRNTALADRYISKKEYAKAIPCLKEVIRKYPDAWLRIKMLGDCYLMSEPRDAQQAQEWYQKVLESPGYQQTMGNPSTPPAMKQDLDLNEELGICASYLGNEKQAQEYFTKVLAQEPDSPATNYFLGMQYYKAGSYRQAARCFQNAATGDRDAARSEAGGGEESPEGPKPSKWGDYWSKLAEPFRKEIARKILDAPLTPPPAEQTGAANKG